MKLKKFACVLTCFAIGGAMCVPFAGCGESSSVDTYKGEVSDKTYTSEESAAAAFVSEEIASDRTSLTYSSYKKQSTLSPSEVDGLELGNIDKSKVESVGKGKVAYTKNSSTASEAALFADTTSEAGKFYVTVYIVKIDVTEEGSSEKKYEYRYYVPLPEVGEAVSKSYYESVFDASKYTNCTATYSMSVKSCIDLGSYMSEQGAGSTLGSVDFGNMEMTIATSGKMEVTQTAAHITADVTTSVALPDSLTSSIPEAYKSMYESTLAAMNTTVKTEYYVVKNADGGADVAYSVDGGKTYTKTSLYYSFGVEEYDELITSKTSAGTEEIVYSFFEKTDYGFTMSTDALKELLDSAVSSAKAMLESEIGVTVSGDTGAKYDFYVSDGRLNKIDCSMLFNMTVDNATYEAGTTMTMEYSAFGSTSVTVSEAAKTAIGA